MVTTTRIALCDLIMAISRTVDLVSPVVSNHHLQVAYIALAIGTELGLPVRQLEKLVIAAALHDIGALSLQDRLVNLQFEVDSPHQHALMGCQLLKSFGPFNEVADIIAHHHIRWDEGRQLALQEQHIPTESYIIHISDRIAVLINNDDEVLEHAEEVCKTIAAQSGKMFMPQLVEIFKELSSRQYFWLEATSPMIDSILKNRINLAYISTGQDELISLSQMFSRIIDFRSPYTAAHSSGVAAVARTLAEKAGFSKKECHLIFISGYLHDLGKLAIPEEILNKPGRLTSREYNTIKKHAYYTYSILSQINGLETIALWASLHHEQLGGGGYPFRLKGEDLPVPARIIAVSDIFTALTEDRPYRKGMGNYNALEMLQGLTAENKLDPNIVALLEENLDEVSYICTNTQKLISREFMEIVKDSCPGLHNKRE